MNDAELIRAALTALAFRDQDRLARLRAKYRPHHPRSETEQLLHTTAICIRLHFNSNDTNDSSSSSGTGKDGEDRPDPDRLARFLAGARRAGPGYQAPDNFLDLEGVIRALAGEPGILEHIDPTSLARILVFLVQYLTDTTPEIRNDFDHIIDQARQQIRRQVMNES